MKFRILILISAMLVSINAQASLAGKNVIMVHGFRAADLQEPPSVADQAQLAREYFDEFWTSRAEGFLFFSSAERVTGGIKDSIRNQISAFEQNGLCIDGCILVTHSTGDLVVRDALSRLGQWGIDQNRFRVLSVLDLAGAGGGTEIADVAATVAQGGGLANAALRGVASAVLGFDITPDTLGVLNDLRPGTARAIATTNQPFPRLRFAGTGVEFAGITKPFILGGDDSVVPLHSACASRTRDNFESCSRDIRPNGQIRRSSGPRSLLHNNFAVLMGQRTGHGNHISDEPDGFLTTVVNDQSIGGLNIDFATSTGRKFWSWFRDVRRVDGSNRQSMSETIFETLDN